MVESNPPETDLAGKIWTLCEPVLRGEGMELVEVEYRREAPGWVLRFFIDQPGGITVEDCAQVSRVLGDYLDVTDAIATAYHLEVSSPGLNRPLRRPEHFEKVLGDIIEVKALEPLDGRRKFKGRLTGFAGGVVEMNCDGETFQIDLGNVDRARLCYFDSREQ